MKFNLSFKTPDVDTQLEDLEEDDLRAAEELFEKFIKYGECVTLEFDTDNETAAVVPLKGTNHINYGILVLVRLEFGAFRLIQTDTITGEDAAKIAFRHVYGRKEKNYDEVLNKTLLMSIEHPEFDEQNKLLNYVK